MPVSASTYAKQSVFIVQIYSHLLYQDVHMCSCTCKSETHPHDIVFRFANCFCYICMHIIYMYTVHVYVHAYTFCLNKACFNLGTSTSGYWSVKRLNLRQKAPPTPSQPVHHPHKMNSLPCLNLVNPPQTERKKQKVSRITDKFPPL